MQNLKFHLLNPKPLMAAVAMMIALAVLADLPGKSSLGSKSSGEVCQGTVQPDIALNRQQLAQLLAVPEGDRKEKVRAILKEPYCKLPSLEVRVGATSEREAYPLEFDPQIWLVVLYEGNQYAGYRFDFR